MIISIYTYYAICAVFVLLCAIPALYTRFVKKKGNDKDWTYLLVILLVPLNWYTPAIFTVTGCEEYTKEVLLFPTSNYSLGEHAYVVNQTGGSLYLEYIVYGNVRADKILDNVIIEPETTYQHTRVTIEYVLEEAPESINSKSDGSVHCRLSCLP